MRNAIRNHLQNSIEETLDSAIPDDWCEDAGAFAHKVGSLWVTGGAEVLSVEERRGTLLIGEKTVTATFSGQINQCPPMIENVAVFASYIEDVNREIESTVRLLDSSFDQMSLLSLVRVRRLLRPLASA